MTPIIFTRLDTHFYTPLLISKALKKDTQTKVIKERNFLMLDFEFRLNFG